MSRPAKTARRRWRVRTLRGRLTLGLVLVLLLSCAVTGVATALFLRGFLINRLDAQLAAAGGRYSASLEHAAPTDGQHDENSGNDFDDYPVVPGQSVGTLGARISGSTITNAAVVGPDGRNRRLPLSPSVAAALRRVPADARPHTVHLEDIGDYRVQAVQGHDGDIQLTGLPMGEIDDVLGRLGTTELILFLVVVVASGAATAILVRRTLEPLRHVADTALHVSELPLTDAATPLPSRVAPAEPSTEADQVSVAFDHMLDHLRTALAARDRTEARLRRFVADASHELRTPLATIRAYSEYATRCETSLPDTTVSALGRIDAAAVRMTQLVDDLLLLARLDAGRPLAKTSVDLTQLVVEGVDDARTAAPDHRWRLELPDAPITVTGDPPRLHQVLVNLLSNASTHTPAGTTVTVRLEGADGHVRVDVCDDGPGIPDRQQEELFERFTRADESRGPGHGSTGLGLAIARGIAAAHGGTLTAESGPGRTCFTLMLPVS